MATNSINEAFQGVEVAGNMASKLATILLEFSSKSDICSLFHFGCFSREETNSLPLFSLELFLITVLFKNGPSLTGALTAL